MIYNVFNENLLTYCKEPQFQGQHIDLAPPPMIINEEEYEIEHNQWIAETGLSHAKEVIEDYWTRILSQNL